MKLVVGLGNPGKEYEKTRHNVGWRVLDLMKLDFSFEKKFNAEVAKVGDVLFCKPQTFMNLSGESVRAIADYYKITPTDILLVYDDKDLPFRTIRLRSTGSAGGHNGVSSVIQHLGTQNIGRVRIGIASETPIIETADFVLARFTKEEETALPDILKSAVAEIQKYINEDKLIHQDIVIG